MTILWLVQPISHFDGQKRQVILDQLLRLCVRVKVRVMRNFINCQAILWIDPMRAEPSVRVPEKFA
ncbi:MAG: hypothetical protein DWQ00_07880 [Candidatus Scalindua sp.]|nr:MAG: hypothetical protein DWQ00_07880 [Candidatus Scalindua sp.]